MISKRVENILKDIPSNVKLVAAVKTRDTKEILDAINSGIKIIGDNYVQEAKARFENLSGKVEWHLIGHLQKNKVKDAVRIFDVIETLDSLELAKIIDKECKNIGKIMSVMVEINIGEEENKSGIKFNDVGIFLDKISRFENLEVIGLMTMGSFGINKLEVRNEFRKMKNLFDKFNLKYLSMGMSNNYKIAIEEGANIIRIGTNLFGKRN